MVIMASGIATHDGDDDGGVAQTGLVHFADPQSMDYPIWRVVKG